jgi:hypothetical protein
LRGWVSGDLSFFKIRLIRPMRLIRPISSITPAP